MMSVLASPILARWLMNCAASMNFVPACMPPLMPNVSTAPQPFGRYFCASHDTDCRAGGVIDPATCGCSSRNCATASALLQCRSMRTCSVSSPCSRRNALNGDSVGPKRAQRLHARFHREAEIAEGLVRSARRGSRCEGSVMPGNLPLSHGNLPDSTTTPPMVVPCPPMYLVAECTTMSAPCSNGRHR